MSVVVQICSAMAENSAATGTVQSMTHVTSCGRRENSSLASRDTADGFPCRLPRMKADLSRANATTLSFATGGFYPPDTL